MHRMQSDGWPYSKSGTKYAARTPEYADGTNAQKSPKLGLSHAVICSIFIRYRVLVVLYSTYLVQI